MPPRPLGLVPLAIFGWAVAANLDAGSPAMLLWICNICNGLLGVGLLASWPRAIWLATLWLVFTMPIWAADAWLYSGAELHSYFTHIVTTALGFAVLPQVPKSRGLWWQALLLLASLQIVTRLTTAPSDNVNSAWATWAPLAPLVPNHLIYWLGNAVLFAPLLAGLERLLERRTRKRLL